MPIKMVKMPRVKLEQNSVYCGITNNTKSQTPLKSYIETKAVVVKLTGMSKNVVFRILSFSVVLRAI